jgi:4-amino-4-deoxy-L-arabinose transferase-like glycosyltransferase
MQLSLNSVIEWFKGGLNKWRLAFIAFIVIYGLFLVFGVNEIFGLAHMSIQWDEVANLSGGLLLLRGNFQQYLSLNTFYPPLYALFTAGSFAVGGVGVFMGRLVSVVFSLLSLYVVFEFTYRMYGAKTALLASILLAVMPGYIWLSRVAMIETTLLFFFLLSTLSFFFWLKEHKNRFLALSLVTFTLGVLTKYQTVIVVAIAVVGVAFLGRDYLMKKFRTLPRLAITVVVVVVPLAVLFYFLYTSGMLNQWLYALNIGNPDKTLYSTGLNRFPAWYDSLPNWIQVPIFYLIELTAQYPTVHPISFLIYAIGLAGLGWLAWRRKAEDKYLLIWFVIVYVFFTAIPNREWRYLIPIFPVLAISAASLVTSALSKAQKTWRLPQLSVSKKRLVQVAAGALIALTLVGFFYSASDAYSMSKDQIYMPLQEATNYVASQLEPGENIMVLCAFNLMDERIVWFYLNEKTMVNTGVYQYPTNPVDTYTPNFNMTELINQCTTYNIKYLLIDEFGGAKYHYFGTDISFYDFNQTLMSTKRFTYLPVSFWEAPARIFVLTFS